MAHRVVQEQSAAHHPVEGVPQEQRVHAGHRDQEVEGERTPDDGGQLGDGLGRPQAVEAGQQGALEGSGDLEVDQGGRELPGVAPRDEEPRLEQGAAHLLDVERDAAGRRHDPVQHLFGQPPALPQRGHQLADVVLLERVEVDGGHRRVGTPGGFELGTGGQEDEDGGVADPLDEALDGVEGGRVAPVEVLDQEDEGPGSAEGDDPGHQRLDGPLESQLSARSTRPGRSGSRAVGR